MVYITYICIAAPLLLMLMMLEKQARTLVGYLVIGATICLIASDANVLIQNFFPLMDIVQYTSYVTPVTEELLKACPVLFYAICISDKPKSILLVGLSVGFGFAILENIVLIAGNAQSIDLFWAIVRGFATGLMHGVCTAIVSLGASFIYKKKKLFYTGTFGLLCVSITYHSIYNILVQSEYMKIALFIPIVTYGVCLVLLNRKRLFKWPAKELST